MRDRKKTFKFFTVMEYIEEQEYLRRMHQEGWKFAGVSLPGIYSFKKCEPEDVVYQLDYNQDGQKQKAEYVQIFSDCGWEYICDFVGYSYFRKPVAQMGQEEEIFNDDASKLDMLERVFKGRMLPLLVIFLCIICPQLFRFSYDISGDGMIMFLLFALMFLLYLGIFIKAAVAYRRLRGRVGNSGL